MVCCRISSLWIPFINNFECAVVKLHEMSQSEVSHSICTLPVLGRNKEFIIKTSWHDENIDVTIYDGENVYKGTLEKGRISELSYQLGIAIGDYIDQCKMALSTNGGHKDFIYVFEGMLFQWKKILSDMKITFGTLELTAVPAVSSIYEIIEVSVNNNYHLKEKVSKLEQERDLLENDNRELLQRIGDCINLKNDMESQLYSQFLKILNAKKKKIKHLESQLKSNGIEVTHEENEEDDREVIDEDEEKRKLYDCETDVDTDDSDNVEEKEKTKNSKEPIKIQHSISDSDSDSLVSYELPKRYKINKKALEESKDIGIDDKLELSTTSSNSNVRKLRNKKRISEERETSNYINRPGSSGVKIFKVANKIIESDLKKATEIKSKKKFLASESDDETNLDSIKQIKNNHSNKLLKKNESLSGFCSARKIINGKEENNLDCIKCKTVEQISENGQNVSNVDDILANLIG